MALPSLQLHLGRQPAAAVHLIGAVTAYLQRNLQTLLLGCRLLQLVTQLPRLMPAGGRKMLRLCCGLLRCFTLLPAYISRFNFAHWWQQLLCMGGCLTEHIEWLGVSWDAHQTCS